MAERVGFEPTVRLPVKRFSSSKILMLGRVALYLTIRSCLMILVCNAQYRSVSRGLQFGLQALVTAHVRRRG